MNEREEEEDEARRDGRDRTIYIRGLTSTVVKTEEDLMNACRPFGEVSKVRLCGRTDVPVRFAFVEFRTAAAAREAVRSLSTTRVVRDSVASLSPLGVRLAARRC